MLDCLYLSVNAVVLTGHGEARRTCSGRKKWNVRAQGDARNPSIDQKARSWMSWVRL